MNVDDALESWVPVVQGNLYVNFVNSKIVQTRQDRIIASSLNNIIMNFGGAWGGDNPFIITDPTQGCLAPRTQTPWSVLTLFGVATAGTVSMGIYWIVLTILTRLARAENSAAYVKAIEDRTPNGLFTWMLQATSLAGAGEKVKCAGLKRWFLEPDPEEQNIRLQTFEKEDERLGSISVQSMKEEMAATSPTQVEVQPKPFVRPAFTM